MSVEPGVRDHLVQAQQRSAGLGPGALVVVPVVESRYLAGGAVLASYIIEKALVALAVVAVVATALGYLAVSGGVDWSPDDSAPFSGIKLGWLSSSA